MCFRPLVDIQQFNKINLVKPLVLDREVVLRIQKRRNGRDSHQIEQLHTSLEKVCGYFDNELRWLTVSDLRRDLRMSPNGIQRTVGILKDISYIREGHLKGKEPKKGMRRFFCSNQNYNSIKYLQDSRELEKQKKIGRTKLDYELLKEMIRLSETTMSKNQVAKKFGLKSPKSFDGMVRRHPSLLRYREVFRKLNENKSEYLGTVKLLERPRIDLSVPMFVKIPKLGLASF